MQPSIPQYNAKYWELNTAFTHEFKTATRFADDNIATAEERHQVRNRNFYGVLGRRVSCHIGDKLINGRLAKDLFPKEVQYLGQIIEASLLEQWYQINGILSDRVDYFQAIFKIFSQNIIGSPKIDEELAIPGGKRCMPVPYGEAESSAVKSVRGLLERAFQFQLLKNDDSLKGAELVALGNQEVKNALLAALKQIDCFFDGSMKMLRHRFLDKDVQLRWVAGAGCKILESSEIEEWIERHPTNKEYRSKKVLERLENYQLLVRNIVDYNLTIQFVQELSDRLGVIKVSLNSGALNAIRQAICPGIKEKKFEDVAIAEIRCVPLNPVTYDSPDFLEYVHFFQVKLQKPALNQVMDSIKA